MKENAVLAAIGFHPGHLNMPVRRALEQPEAHVTAWRAEKLGGGAGNPVSLGLFRFTGTAETTSGSLDWSLVLKAIQSPARQGFSGMGEGQDHRHWNYWQREYHVFKSGFLLRLPAGISAPRCFALQKRAVDVIWLWMEHVQDAAAARWSVDRYQQAARQLGKMQGNFAAGRLPRYTWLSQNFYRQWLRLFTDYLPGAPEIYGQAPIWSQPQVRMRYDSSGSDAFERLLTGHPRFLAVLEQLPKTICHNDTYPTNFMTCAGPDGSLRLLLLDWALVGVGPLGSDLGQLALGAFLDSGSDLDAWIPDLLLDAYLQGVADSGFKVAHRQVRFAFAACAAFRAGLFQLYLLNDSLQKGQLPGDAEIPPCAACFETRMAEIAWELLPSLE